MCLHCQVLCAYIVEPFALTSSNLECLHRQILCAYIVAYIVGPYICAFIAPTSPKFVRFCWNLCAFIRDQKYLHCQILCAYIAGPYVSLLQTKNTYINKIGEYTLLVPLCFYGTNVGPCTLLLQIKSIYIIKPYPLLHYWALYVISLQTKRILHSCLRFQALCPYLIRSYRNSY